MVLFRAQQKNQERNYFDGTIWKEVEQVLVGRVQLAAGILLLPQQFRAVHHVPLPAHVTSKQARSDLMAAR